MIADAVNAYPPLGHWQRSNLTRLPPKRGSVIYRQTGFRLPLMHQLVQHGVLDLRPWMPCYMATAQADVGGAAGLEVDCQLTQSPFHATRQSNGKLTEGSAEVPKVEVTMQSLQAMEQSHISRAGPLATRRALRCRRVGMHRKFEELSFGRSAQHPRDSGIQKPNDCLQHAIRSEGVPPMNAQHSPVKTEHHRLVRVGQDSFDIT
jgi:hypothetical protein